MQMPPRTTGARRSDSRKVSLPQIAQPQLPKGGGALTNINSSFQPQAFSGTGQMVVALPASSCRGFEPQLELEYDSAQGNGPFGVGFRLSLQQISCDAPKRIPS